MSLRRSTCGLQSYTRVLHERPVASMTQQYPLWAAIRGQLVASHPRPLASGQVSRPRREDAPRGTQHPAAEEPAAPESEAADGDG